MLDPPPIFWSKASRLRRSSPGTGGWCAQRFPCPVFSRQYPESREQPTDDVVEDVGTIQTAQMVLTSGRIILDGAIHVLPPYFRVAFKSWK
jgi:hypothetical protein